MEVKTHQAAQDDKIREIPSESHIQRKHVLKKNDDHCFEYKLGWSKYVR